MRKAKLLVLMTVAVWLLASSLAHAYLLDQYFGVNPTLSTVTFNYTTNLENEGTYTAYRFDGASLAPTLHAGTTDVTVNDWFGYWGPFPGEYATYSGDYPAGEEPYDTEAYYFDDDGTNLYFAAIVGFPSPATGIFQDPRDGRQIIQGDFAIDLPGGSGSQTDSWGFSYEYGVDLVDEIRPDTGNVDQLASNSLGSTVYNTTSGWYMGTPDGGANPTFADPSNAFTNFDPSYGGGAGMSAVGSATTNWYQLALPNQENNWNTYVLEITIPRAILPTLNARDTLQYHWLAGCRNDGSAATAYLTGSGDIDTPEPGTLALVLIGVGPLGMWVRRRKQKLS
jgi:hypothetical protein